MTDAKFSIHEQHELRFMIDHHINPTFMPTVKAVFDGILRCSFVLLISGRAR